MKLQRFVLVVLCGMLAVNGYCGSVLGIGFTSSKRALGEDKIFGLDVGLPISKVETVIGLQLGLGQSVVTKRITGLQLSLVNSDGGGDTTNQSVAIQFAAGWSNTQRMAGLELSGLANFGAEFKGLQLSALHNLLEGESDALQITGIWNRQEGVLTGAQIAGAMNTAEQFRGVQISGLYNRIDNRLYADDADRFASPSCGLQLAGGVNTCSGSYTGVQLAGLGNLRCANEEAAKLEAEKTHFTGLQAAGLYNYSPKVVGMQLGLVNRCYTLKGVQLGLLNMVDGSPWKYMPVLNVRF